MEELWKRCGSRRSGTAIRHETTVWPKRGFPQQVGVLSVRPYLRTSCHRLGWRRTDGNGCLRPPHPLQEGITLTNDSSKKHSRAALLEFSYAEILDATKHQDDKVGRLLTGVAFLTAAALALANLAGGKYLLRPFSVSPGEAPLALISLTGFLVAVVFCVVLLVTSLATPLRLPGLARHRTLAPMSYVSGVKTSQLYFYEIAGVSVEEWDKKWRADPESIATEREESLIRETHNLAVRTNFKYDRAGEAVAVLATGLLAFLSAVLFVAFAAATPGDVKPILLNHFQRTLLACAVTAYCVLQIAGRLRYEHQAVEETARQGKDTSARRRLWAHRTYALSVSAAIGSVLLPYGGVSRWGLSTTTTCSGVALVSFWRATVPEQGSKATAEIRKRHARQRKVRRGIVTTSLIALVASASVAVARSWYGAQLLTAYAAALVLFMPTALGPLLMFRERQWRYEQRYRQPPGGSDLDPQGDPPTS